MSDLINMSICLSDIPKGKIKVGKNGKKYLSLSLARRREPDQFGQTHAVYVSQSKEEREAKENRTYLGSGKEIAFSGNPIPPKAVESMPVMDNNDDLPF